MATKKEEQTVEEKLKSLYLLQTLLTKGDQIKMRRGELPIEVKDLDDEIVGLRTRVNKLKDQLAQIVSDLDENQHAIEQAQELIARYSEQQNDVTSNKQYDHLNKEIEYQNLVIASAEKKISLGKAAQERELEEIKATNALIEEKTQVVETKREELDAIISETKVEEEKLLEKAKKVEAKIDDEYTLNAFKRVRRAARNGLGIVHVDRNACGGCFNRIPAQRQAEVKARKKIIVCEYCGRILVDPELAGVETAE